MKTTFVDRANTNQKVYENAYQVLQTENAKKTRKTRKTEEHLRRQVRPVSDILAERKMSQLGHILRQKFSHPTCQVTFATSADAKTVTPLIIKRHGSKRRTGRPRLNWAFENMKRAWLRINDNEADDLPLHIVGKPYDNYNKDMNKVILQHALERKPPLEGMKSKTLAYRIKPASNSTAREFRGVHDHRLNPFGQIPITSAPVTATPEAS